MIIGTWYGFYPFYYAVENGLDKKYNIRLKILEPTNISNLRRSYLREQVDFAATSMIEFATAQRLTAEEIKPILVTDFSDGGDVIIAHKSLQSIEDLRGARVAVPSNGIGEYVLSLVFDDPEPTKLIQQKKIPETECEENFAKNAIDACVTYPPISTYLLELPDLRTLYSSVDHPQRIFDMVWSKPHVDTSTNEQIRAIWFDAIDIINRDRRAFYEFVSATASVSVESVEESMRGIKLIDRESFTTIKQNPKQFYLDIKRACSIAYEGKCDFISSELEF